MQTQEPNAITPAAAAPATPAGARSAMFIVFLVVFIDLLGFGIVLPLLPRIAKSYVGQVVAAAPAAGPVQALPEHTEYIGYSASALSFVALVLGIWLLRETRRFEDARRWRGSGSTSPAGVSRWRPPRWRRWC